jgi:3-hydroxyisobutyrate dehydrogenase-like beta-hydroxyacid dehydrogenase
VRTFLAGRSAATVARALKFGLRECSYDALVAADLLLSIVPPAEALPVAEKLAPLLRRAPRKPLYADCNAVSPETAARIAAVIAGTGCPFVDASIIGPPPLSAGAATIFHASGSEAPRFAQLAKFGLNIAVLDEPVGAASALKMSYAGLTKGFIALGSAMLLAASRGGAAKSLRELARSQPALFAWLTRQVPGMYSKAHRFVGEMHEIADFLGSEVAERQFFSGAAGLYTRLAADYEGTKREINALSAFLAGSGEDLQAK